MERVNVAILGCGNISPRYLRSLCRVFSMVRVCGVCDIIPERAQRAAQEYGIETIYADEDQLMADPQVDIVVNLTQPAQHTRLNKKIVGCGKHLYTEKPLAMTREDGQDILLLAKKRGVQVAGAPDTFLGAGLQTARRVLEEGRIGRALSATAFMTCHGHEHWHPDPDYYYQPGAGPMMDMGPYYLTALVHLLGPIESIAGASSTGFPKRTVTSPGREGEVIDVNVSTHVSGVINFHSGAIGLVMMSFDIWHAQLPFIEIYGTEGTLSVPDPDRFDGPVKIFRPGMEGYEEVPLEGFAEDTRGAGVADLACSVRNNRPARAGGEQLYHVLDAMRAFEDSHREGMVYRLRSTASVPPMLPAGMTAEEWAKAGD